MDEKKKVTIFLNKDNFVIDALSEDKNIVKEFEIDADELPKYFGVHTIYEAWKMVDNTFILVSLFDDNSLKDRRKKECFNIIDNRSAMWYNHLTNQQKQELEEWYQAWLDVTETKKIPTKPEWL